MIASTRALRVFAYTRPADLRKGFDGLYALVVGELGKDPLSGDCYLFTNRTRRSAKVLVWDGTGLIVLAKRLEEGRFACLWREEETNIASVELTMSELSLFIEGSQWVGRKSLSPRAFVPKSVEQRRST